MKVHGLHSLHLCACTDWDTTFSALAEQQCWRGRMWVLAELNEGTHVGFASPTPASHCCSQSLAVGNSLSHLQIEGGKEEEFK